MIDRASSEPFYLQLGRLLSEQIVSGHYPPGERLPSESELCRQFDLSRSTVRETLRALQNDGKIRLVQRRGAFVCADEHPGWMLQFPEGFSENETTHNNRTVETKVLGVKRGKLPAEACTALNLPQGTSGVMVERVRRVDGQLALYAWNYLVSDLADVIGDGSHLNGAESLNRVLRAAGWMEGGAHRSLSAVAATSALAKHLQVPVGHPLLLIRSIAWDSDRNAFDYYTSWLRSEIVNVSIEVHAAPTSSRSGSKTS